MARNLVNVHLVEEGTRQPVRHVSFDADEKVVVRDDRAQFITAIPAREVSLYRHSLILSGTAFRIMNILSPCAAPLLA